MENIKMAQALSFDFGKAIKARKDLFLALALFILNFLLGLRFINEGLFHYDSVVFAQAIDSLFTGTGLSVVNNRWGFTAIASIIHLPFFMLGKNADFTIRFSGVLFQALSIVVLYLFVKEFLGNRIVAIFTALQFSFTPFYFSPNTYGKEHGMAMFFLLLSFFLVLRGTINKSVRLLISSVAAFLLSVTIRESMLALSPVFFLLYLAPGKLDTEGLAWLKERLQPKLVFAVVLPFVIMLLSLFFGFLKDLIWIEAMHKESAYIRYLGIFSGKLLSALHDLKVSIPWLVFLFALAGIFILFINKKRFTASFLLLWSLLILYFANMNIYIVRYLDVVIIPVYIFSSLSLCALYKKIKLVTVVILSYIIFSMFIFMYPMLRFRHYFNADKRFAYFVKAKTPPGALIISADEWPFISYYGNRQVLIRPLYSKEEAEKFLQTVKGYLKQGRPVYMIESALRPVFTEGERAWPGKKQSSMLEMVVGYGKDSKFNDALNKDFKIEPVGWYLNEDYHRPELSFRLSFEKLFRISLK